MLQLPIFNRLSLIQRSMFSFASQKNKKNNPNLRRISKMKHVDFFNREIKFPIRIKLKYRYIYDPVRKMELPVNQPMNFSKMSGNQILLALEDLKKLKKQQILLALERLAELPGQENFVWTEHEWVNAAFEDIKTSPQYNPSWGLRLYKLMNKLRNKDPDMWKLIYRFMYESLHQIPVPDFIYFWQKYHKDTVHVDEKFREDLFKMMESRLRSFPATNVLNAFRILQEFGKINHYWIQNVFIPLFKGPGYVYKPKELAEIMKILIFLGHEKNPRFYDQFYPKILKLKFQTKEDVQAIRQALEEVQDIFKSHRLEPYMKYLETIKLEEKKVEVLPKKKALAEIVREDLKYWLEKERIKKEQQKQKEKASTAS